MDENGRKRGFNTIECLRARLLAERHASKLANEEAECLGLKLTQLENKLRQEIKFREKAERRLRLLEKKLKSINISSTSGESEHSYSSQKCESSFTSNSSASTDAKENETKPHSTNSLISAHQISKDSIQTHNDPSVSKDCDCTQDLRKNPSPNSENLDNSERRIQIFTAHTQAKAAPAPLKTLVTVNLSSDNEKKGEIRHGI